MLNRLANANGKARSKKQRTRRERRASAFDGENSFIVKTSGEPALSKEQEVKQSKKKIDDDTFVHRRNDSTVSKLARARVLTPSIHSVAGCNYTESRGPSIDLFERRC